MKKIYYEVDIETNRSDKNIRELKKEVSGLVDEINELNETNQIQKEQLLELEERYRKMPKAALQARKAIQNEMEMLNVAIKENNTALAGFRIKKQQKQKLISDLKEVEQNFTRNTDEIVEFGHALGDAAGAMILLSGGSEETTKKLEKGLGVAMAFKSIVHGLKSGINLYNNVLKKSTIFQKLNSAATTTAGTVMKLFGKSVKTTSLSFKALKGAIIATGIGALIIGITSAISAISDFISANDDAEKQQELLAQAIEDTTNQINEENKAYEGQVKILRQKHELEKLDLEQQGAGNQMSYIRIEQIKEEIGLKKEQIKGIKEEAKRLKDLAHNRFMINKDRAEFDRLYAKSDLQRKEAIKQEQALADLEHQKTVAIKKNRIEFNKSSKAERERRAKAIEDQVKGEKKKNLKLDELSKKQKAKDDEARFRLRLARKEANKKTLEDFIEIEKMKRHHLLKNENLTKNERRLIRFESAQEILRITKEFAKRDDELKAEELQKLQEFYKKEQDLQDQQYDLLQELQNTNKEQEEFLLAKEYDEKFLLAVNNAELEKALTEQQNKDLQAINDKYREEEEEKNKQALEKERAIQNSKIRMAADAFGVIGSLANTFAKDTEESQRKAFEINKAVGIAQALIQTYQSAQGAYLSQLSIPTPDAPIRAKVAAGVATAVGLANVAAIAAQKFEYTGGDTPSPPSGAGGLGGGAGLESQPPAFNVVGQSGFNQIAMALGQDQPPLQAFVVSQDVTTAQQLNNAIIQTATF